MLREVDIQPPEYRDPAQMLRNIADGIEAGEYGTVFTVAVALHTPDASPGHVDVFGGGRNSDQAYVAYVLARGHAIVIS